MSRCDFRSHAIPSIYVEVNKLDGKDKGLEKKVMLPFLEAFLG